MAPVRAYNAFRLWEIGWGAVGYAHLWGGHCSHIDGMRVCRGMSGGFGRGGTTIGDTYLTNNKVSRDRIRHEKVHRRQWRKYGDMFPALYFSSGLNPCHNRWERQANLHDGGYDC